MRQMKEEQKKSKGLEAKRMKEITKLKREFKMKEVGLKHHVWINL